MGRKQTTVEDLLAEHGISRAQMERMLRQRQRKPRSPISRAVGRKFSFAVVSDTHLCSTEERLRELSAFYEEVRKRGIKTVVHAGDLVAGWGIYRGQENEVHTFGARNQAEYAVKNYPRVEDVTTYFITGNHCLSWYNRSGVDIGELVDASRNDIVYLGQYEGEIELSGVKIRLIHPDGGGAYALSYKLQKLVEQIPSGRKPHILIAGHYHTALYFFYRNIHAFQAGCFEGQTTFLIRKGINPTIGGWIVDVEVGKDKKHTVLSLSPTFVPFIEREW